MSGRTVIVSGASAGIGAAIAKAQLAVGDQVINLARRPSPEAHPALQDIAVDLANPEAVNAIAPRLAASGATAFVHNAGIIRPALLADVVEADFDALVALHLKAAIRITQALLPAMEQAGKGRVVLIGTRAALGLPTRTAYSATKAAMIGLCRTWALELAPKGVTVNLVSPGPVESEMFHQVVPAGSEREQKLAASIPVGRIGRPDDVAAAVRYFLSDEASFVTGQNLFVCGGASVGSISI